MSNELSIAEETAILARIVAESKGDNGWRVSVSIDDVPSEVGYYALHDGLDLKQAGVTLDMRRAIEGCSAYGKLKRPLFHWLPDTDGSAALWLEGKMRCEHCKGEPTILDVFEADEHLRDAHGISATRTRP